MLPAAKIFTSCSRSTKLGLMRATIIVCLPLVPGHHYRQLGVEGTDHSVPSITVVFRLQLLCNDFTRYDFALFHFTYMCSAYIPLIKTSPINCIYFYSCTWVKNRCVMPTCLQPLWKRLHDLLPSTCRIQHAGFTMFIITWYHCHVTSSQNKMWQFYYDYWCLWKMWLAIAVAVRNFITITYIRLQLHLPNLFLWHHKHTCLSFTLVSTYNI